MNVYINCPSCGKANLIPEAAEYKGENFTKKGSSGTRKCIECESEIVWFGDQLVKESEIEEVEEIEDIEEVDK